MAKYTKWILTDSFEAGEDLSAAQYLAVALSDGAAVLCDGTTVPIGILQNAPAQGGEALVLMVGITPARVKADDVNIAVGDLLTVDNTGYLVKATSDAAKVIGLALEASEVDGDFINVLVLPLGDLSQVIPASGG